MLDIEEPGATKSPSKSAQGLRSIAHKESSPKGVRQESQTANA